MKTFLAGGGGRGRLSVRAREHRSSGVGVCEPAHRLDELPHRRQQHLRARVREHHRVCEVVDVLRGAREVDQLARAGKLGRCRDPLPDEVLDRLDVVVGLALDGLHPPRIVEREAAHEVVEEALRLLAQRCEGVEPRARRERLQPAHLHRHPVSDEAVLARDLPQRSGLRAVSPVHGRDRGQRGQLHRRPGVIRAWGASRRTRPAAREWLPADAGISTPSRASRR